MALARVKVWGAERLYASDLNAEFNNIISNAASLISPLSAGLDWDGYAHTLDAAGVTTAQSTSAIAWSFSPGSKTGSPGTTGMVSNWAANTTTDSATAGSGTATSWTGHSFQRPTLAASNTLVTTTDAATVYIANSPAAGTNETITNAWSLWVDAGNVRLDGNLQVAGDLTVTGNLRSTAALGQDIQGLTYANNAGDATNDIDIAIGMAVSNDAAQANRRTMTLTSALTKRSDDTWAVGSGNGWLDTGAIGNSKYYIWLIMRSDTGVVDSLLSLSATAPDMTLPTSAYDYKRLIGFIARSGGAIRPFTIKELSGGGIWHQWTTTINDVAITNTLTTTRRLDTLTVPVGFSVNAKIRQLIDDVGLSSAICCSPDETDAAPSLTGVPGLTVVTSTANNVFGAQISVWTDTSGRVASRGSTATVDEWDIITVGFEWSRR